MRSDVGRYTPDLQTRTSAVTARRRDERLRSLYCALLRTVQVFHLSSTP